MKRRYSRGGLARVIERPITQSRQGDSRSEMATMRRTKLRPRRIPAATRLGSQDDSAGDFASAQQVQRLVCFGKRPLDHMAAYLPAGSHGEHFAQVLPSTDR